MFVAGAATKARLCSLRALTRTELVPDSNLAGATGELYYDTTTLGALQSHLALAPVAGAATKVPYIVIWRH